MPDLRDRALYGSGSVVQLGQTDGRSTGNRGGPNHSHNLAGPGAAASAGGAHTHSVPAMAYDYGQYYGGYDPPFPVYKASSATSGASSPNTHGHGLQGQTSGGYDLDRPSFAGVTFIITTGIGVGG